MIIKNILVKVNIHYLNYLLAVLVILTGMFKEYLIVFSIIIIHELGHVIVALLFRWKIDKVNIYPFGGCVDFCERLNKPLVEELFIMLAGPIVQTLLFFLIIILFENNYISMRTFSLFKNYHYSLLLFNLLPAIPLDGGRLLNIIINYLAPYKKSLKIVSIIAYIVLFVVFFISIFRNNNVNLVPITIFLISKVYIEKKNINYLFNKFLLERYLMKFNFKKRKVVLENDFYRDYVHTIKHNKHYITEKEYLKKRFNNI